jgi:hypothetical protein
MGASVKLKAISHPDSRQCHICKQKWHAMGAIAMENEVWYSFSNEILF